MKQNDRKQLILKAASECFSRYGYEKTTLEDIGGAINLNKASLYYYYKNKEDIFIAVILKESEEYLSALQEKVAIYQVVEEKILHYLSERLKYYKEVLNLHQLSIESIRKIEPLFEELYQMVMQKEIAFIEEQLTKGVKNGEFKEADMELVAESVLVVTDAIKHQAVRKSPLQFASQVDYSSIESKIHYTIQLILNGLKK